MKHTIASIVALSAMVANAGPFGYEMGLTMPDSQPGALGYHFTNYGNGNCEEDELLDLL